MEADKLIEEEANKAEEEREMSQLTKQQRRKVLKRAKRRILNAQKEAELAAANKRPIAENLNNNLYDSDSSDAEAAKNPNKVGNIPMEWYEEYEHIGYGLDGQPITKSASSDAIDKFLQDHDSGGLQWRTVWDDKQQRNIVLSEKEYDMLRRIHSGQLPDKEAVADPAWETIPEQMHENGIFAVKDRSFHKSRFVPNKWEYKRIAKLTKKILKGYIKFDQISEPPRFYNLWEKEPPRSRHVSRAPHAHPIGHAGSYHPPPEYLMDAKEEKEWKEAHPDDRKLKFIPRDFDKFRSVPAYPAFVRERFERCLDLYLCPRTVPTKPRKKKLDIEKDILPQLPNPKELRPYPTTLSIEYVGHNSSVLSISVSPTGTWLASGSKDKTLKIWEVNTGRCMKTYTFESAVIFVAWNPNPSFLFLAVSLKDGRVVFVNPQLGPTLMTEVVDKLLLNHITKKTKTSEKLGVSWAKIEDSKLYDSGVRIQLNLRKATKGDELSWHQKGDYLSVVSRVASSGGGGVLIIRMSGKVIQRPFKKGNRQLQSVRFHPVLPLLFVASQISIRIYDLMKQELIKKLQTGVENISSFDIHPQGDNVIMGSYDRKVCWFDTDLSVRPYRILKYHKNVVRQTVFHRHNPLFATASDDGTVHVFHGMVYSDLLTNPLIVPLYILRGHSVVNDQGVLDCMFHPNQPWLFTAGADSKIFLFTSNN
eukprot:TRINITY_DN9889_c0_g1_i1.p1 TRINITY_DN9889_c0_g1~~TRINITY_DN9889_c0_g1_i1.p1  ORF type:complete len:810 (-),score=151.80 TRINITY_DN9889_c0_g1_i1:38-2146(-)